MIAHKCDQGGTAWLQLRAGIPTASEFRHIMTPLFKAKTGEGPRSYLATKIAEHWTGGPLDGGSSFAMEQGKILEKHAIPYVELQTGLAVDRVGFITTDDKRVGCSPDGLIGEDSGLEVKCPQPAAHVKYLLDGEVPEDYRPQLYGCMYVTGRPEWKFLSYQRGFPKLLLTVKRDEEIMQKIEAILVHFLEAFDDALEMMIRANAGVRPPKKKLYEEADWVSQPLSQLTPCPP